MSPKSPVLVRGIGTCFAIVLALQAAWIVAPELIRPGVDIFPANATEANASAANDDAAATAAWIGWPRGELWIDYAVAANAGRVDDLESNAPSAPGPNATAKAAAETAASLEPADARAWVLIALNAQTSPNNSGVLAPLKMSYYTSAYSDELFPLRLAIATRSPDIADEELSIYVEYELGVVIAHKAELRPAISRAYRNASPAGRAFFDQTLAKLDPKYLIDLKSKP